MSASSTLRRRLLRTANTVTKTTKRRKVVVPILAPIVILRREGLADGIGVTAVLALPLASMGARSVGI